MQICSSLSTQNECLEIAYPCVSCKVNNETICQFFDPCTNATIAKCVDPIYNYGLSCKQWSDLNTGNQLYEILCVSSLGLVILLCVAIFIWNNYKGTRYERYNTIT